jgi:uncharacterized membrane protein YhiD involved in acid resistance|tara:strand:+ start:1668 stop:2351 length:684 start_codon:yes stop_codon:yes gene_type:complete
MNQVLDLDIGNAFVYGPINIVLNISIACILGLIISAVYKGTHKGLSYSQSFMLTVVLVTVIVAMVMMVIGNNLARAFALVGALSIIRFRTVVKDTKDTAYVFFALAGGMAAGTGSYFLAFAGVAIISGFAYVLHLTNYGSLYKSEFILKFRADPNSVDLYEAVIHKYSKVSHLLHVEPSGDLHKTNLLTFDIILRKDTEPNAFTRDIDSINGISEVKLIASKYDVDY